MLQSADVAHFDLGSANQWQRAKPGPARIFLSFHGEDYEGALQVKTALTSENIAVASYDPANRWPDGPMEMLRQMVTECHCVVYFGPPRTKSRFVHFELRIAREFSVKVVHLKSIRRLSRAVAKIREEAERTHKPDLLWGWTVSKAITAACEELAAADIVDSELDRTGSTGLDLLGRHFGLKLREDLAVQLRLTQRDKVILGSLLAAGLLFVCGGICGTVWYFFLR
jgi:hypothetical protein